LFTHPPVKFETFLGLAKAAIGSGTLKPAKLDPENLQESEIDMHAFASWAKATGLAFPMGFPWQPLMDIAASGWPWGRYDTDLLRKLAGAVERFWINHDPKEPDTAPTNDEVIEWLKAQDVSGNIAQAMATIIRPDKLPPGRRRG
jgi:hypothetical protein